MARSTERSKRKASGGLYKKSHKKRMHSLASQPTLTTFGETRIKIKRVRAGRKKSLLLKANKANVYNPKTKKYTVTEITRIIENPANRHYVRRNIITKGTVIETKLGKAKITSRPGQQPIINAVSI